MVRNLQEWSHPPGIAPSTPGMVLISRIGPIISKNGIFISKNVPLLRIGPYSQIMIPLLNEWSPLLKEWSITHKEWSFPQGMVLSSRIGPHLSSNGLKEWSPPQVMVSSQGMVSSHGMVPCLHLLLYPDVFNRTIKMFTPASIPPCLEQNT